MRNLLLLLLLGLAGCGAGNGDADPTLDLPQSPPVDVDATADTSQVSTPGSDAENAAADPRGNDGRPETREFEVQIEGTSETMYGDLFESPAGFPLPFSTYVPRDMNPEAGGSAGDASVRFIAEFGGHRNEDAFVEVVVLPAGQSESAAREAAREVATSLGGGRAAESARDGAVAAFPFAGEFTGRLILDEHDGRWHYILVHYPPEYGDGMAPRLNLLLSEWRWEGS